MGDAPLVFFEDGNSDVPRSGTDAWKILVVDDDQDVHSVTEFVMHGVTILGQGLRFLHAYSAAEARSILKQEHDIAVILLDVVMESEDAGLTLVRTVRDELGYQATRIILRTGQPGYAPEYEAIRDYDINDYRTKSELSYARLLTSLTAAIRSYVQIKTIAENNLGLEFIIHSAPELLSRTTFDSFAVELIAKMRGLLAVEFDSFLLLVPQIENHPDKNSVRVIGGSGAYETLQGSLWPVAAIPEVDRLAEKIDVCLLNKESQFGDTWACLYFQGTMYKDLCLYVKTPVPVSVHQRKMIEVFSVAAGMGYQNMLLLNQLRNLAFQDSATGLLNRTGFIGAIDQIAAEKRRDQAVALIDIEDFSEINEVFGHDFGDDLLQAVADRLSTCFEETVICGRVSADGFALLGRNKLLEPDLIAGIFSNPFTVEQHSMHLRIVCGLVKLGDAEGDGADMVKDAFIAVKIAKLQQQSRYYYYNPQLEVEARKKLGLLEDLQRSLLQNDLELYYQPQVDMGTKKVTGLEALLRWRRQDGQMVSPSVFIPLAEQSGLIVEIGDWVLNKVCQQIREWRDKKLKPLRVAVNISVRQFHNPNFLPALINMIARYELSVDLFELEITESMAMHDVKAILDLLKHIKELGFFIAIDDFGTGFSSLSYLQQLPIDKLKIDRSFIAGIHEAERNRAIAGLIVGLGRSLGLTVIAEGVEDPQQSAILTELGCFEAQGYLFGKPMDAATVTQWLLKNHS